MSEIIQPRPNLSPSEEPARLEGAELAFLRDVPVEISVEVGRRRLSIGEVLSLGPGSLIELSKAANEPLDIRVNGVLVARGEAVVIGDRFGVRLTAMVETSRLLSSLSA
jgi:flagellar motor switch protein FliN/FliY